MTIQFANNLSTVLSNGITDSATTITVADASGFPAVSVDDYLVATIEDPEGDIEIVHVTGVSGNDLTVVRGQDGTAAQAFNVGVLLQSRVTASILNEFYQKSSDVDLYNQTTFRQSGGYIADSDANNTSAVFRTSKSAEDAYISFLVAGNYGVNFGLHGATQKLSVGGWSMGAETYALYHEGNQPNATEVPYDSASNNIAATNTQEAIDEIEARTDTAESKLAGIESGATADQTASEILTLLKTVDTNTSGLNADTVDGIQGSSLVQTSRSVSAGNGLTGGGDLTTNRTISHADTSSQASVNNSGNTVIQDITLDEYGHVTGLANKTLSIPASTGQNILINGDLFINQRGFNGTWTSLAENEYGYDRWRRSGSNIQQIVEAGSFVNGATYTLSGTNVTTQQLTAPSSASANWTITVPNTATNIKLEYGSVATPFIPDDPATNLAKCQRYYQDLRLEEVPFAGRAIDEYSGAALNYAGRFMNISEMRVTPTVSYTIGISANVASPVLSAAGRVLYCAARAKAAGRFYVEFTSGKLDAEL